MKEQICGELDGIAIQTQSKYLGLPLVVGRSKTQVFKYIVDAAVKRISSWKNNFLSCAGKEILLKSVVSALPIYSMSCYRLTNSVCNQIEQRMANSWWGEQGNKRRIHWAKWTKLTASKPDGGLAFKDLKLMNEALLAKQLWNLMTVPHSLMARILKAKYFPRNSLLEAQPRGHDSWIWKSWLSARSLLVRGLAWKVGDGRNIRIWEDSWIPDSSIRPPLTGKPATCAISHVSDLIDHTQLCWDYRLVSSLFSPSETQLIMRIPVHVYGTPDQLLWQKDKKGFFTVKSAYMLADSLTHCAIQAAESSTTRATNRRMWRHLWKLPIKPKLKHFLWRCLHNWLATGQAVQKRGMEIEAICRRCGEEQETREHLFFHCPDSALIWKLAPVSWDGLQHLTHSFEDWWRMFNSAKSSAHFQKRLELTIYLLWNIWKARCLWQFDGQRRCALEVVQMAHHEWEEYADIHQASKFMHLPHCNSPPVSRHPPAVVPSTVIINVAAEAHNATNTVGLSWQIQREDGGMVLSEARLHHADHQDSFAELRAVQLALQAAHRWNVKSVEVRLDVKAIVTWLQQKVPPLPDASSIVGNILLLRDGFELCKFVFIHSFWNATCHALAKQTLSNGCPSLERRSPLLGVP